MKKMKENSNLYEMANIKQSTSGLPVIIFISPKGRANHGHRVKVQNNYSSNTQEGNFFSITISEDPEIIGDIGEVKSSDLRKIREFVIKNKEVLLDYWNDKIDTAEVIEKLF